jgi:alkylation response protein AidB-like acyl-CoA dehydrogenase
MNGKPGRPFTPEHEMLRASIRSFVEREVTPQVAAWARGDRYHLTGSKIFITNGVYGDLYFVAARTGPATDGRRHDSISMFLVERDTPGLSVSRKLGMRASDTAELVFQDCAVPAENLLGQEGRGFQQLAAGLQRERMLAGVLALSGATQALEDTMAYLRSASPSASRSASARRCATGWPTWPPRWRPPVACSITPPSCTRPARNA